MVNNKDKLSLLNELMHLASEVKWREGQTRSDIFLKMKINGFGFYYWPTENCIKTHSKYANEYMEMRLGRKADRKSDDKTVYIWDLSK